MTPKSGEALRERLHSVIERGAGATLNPAEFERLALDVFAYQYAGSPIYRAFCDSRDASPRTVTAWLDIPAVPTDAFKAAPVACGDPAAAAVFRTSGTTGGSERRGTHHMMRTDLYSASLRAGFRRHLLPEGGRILMASLVPHPADQPDSSLSFMMGDVVERFGSAESEFFVSGDRLRADDLVRYAADAGGRGMPLLIVGTSIAFVHLLDRLAATGAELTLPPGSRAMDTGGFKGRSLEIGRAELYSRIGQHLGIPPTHIVNEYGMTEMSSQLYDGIVGSAPNLGVPRLHTGPPWLRTIAVDPETLHPLPPGATGVLRHFDLANLYSVMALQTADLGKVTPEGIELMGRARGAEVRGCSIAMDELLQAMRSVS